MKSKIAGVALAAVMGACALASGADADTLSFSVSTPGDVYSSAFVDIDTAKPFASFGYFAQYECGNFSPDCPNGYHVVGTYSGTSADYSLSFSPSGFDDPNHPSLLFSGYVANISFYGGIYANGADDVSATFRVGGSSFSTGETYGGSVQYSVSEVPLPPSAPLFGAALLALGGATYARRRLTKDASATAA